MDLNKKLKELLAEKKALTASIDLCCQSIAFWEKKSEEMFKRMDEFEEETVFENDEIIEKKFRALRKESEGMMSRINFENSELDRLEIEILELEDKIVKEIASYAKKQKK